MLLSKYHSCVLKSKVLGSEVKFVKKHLKKSSDGLLFTEIKCQLQSAFFVFKNHNSHHSRDNKS